MQNGRYTGNDIVRDIEKQILNNHLARGVRLNTSRELAARYSVSLKTVERAMARLRHRGLISRVRGRGSFVLSSQPPLNKLRVCLFCFSRPNFLNDSPAATFAAFDYLQQQIQRQLLEAGYNLDYLTEAPNLDKPHSRLLRTCLDKYDIVITPAGVLEYAEEYLRECKSQVILIMDDVVRHGPWHQIVYDYRQGFSSALALFRKLGCSRILSVGFADEETSAHRMGVFREEAARMGFPEKNIVDYFGECNPVSRFLTGQVFAEYYLDRKLFDHAVFSTSDFLTLGMYTVFEKRGVLPGRDLQLISYDNFEGRLNRPDFRFGITGITHPQDEMARALSALLESLEKIPSGNDFYKTYFVPAKELVIRDSTAKGVTIKSNGRKNRMQD